MTGQPVEVALEAVYKREIRLVQKRLNELNRLESEAGESYEANIDVYIRQKELRSYITHYRIALEQLRRGGIIKADSLSRLTEAEKAVLTERFR